MIPFAKPLFDFDYDIETEIRALRRYRATKPGRAIPRKEADKLLVASWNVANLGVQDRRADDFRLIAEMIHWFDLVALQEVGDDLSHTASRSTRSQANNAPDARSR